jgi:hypothetical protein
MQHKPLIIDLNRPTSLGTSTIDLGNDVSQMWMRATDVDPDFVNTRVVRELIRQSMLERARDRQGIIDAAYRGRYATLQQLYDFKSTKSVVIHTQHCSFIRVLPHDAKTY